jgi:hypothetical protein
MSVEVSQPTIGRIVHYRLSEQDMPRITALVNEPRPSGRSHVLNPTRVGDTVPAIVVASWAEQTANLHVLLDGEVTLWVTSAKEGDVPGTWAWPPRV